MASVFEQASAFEQQSAVRVLIVEDNDAQRRILTDLIRDEGFDVVACSNAAEALVQTAAGLFGVAILDQRLPEMSGTELLERLRTRQRGLRAIIHTAFGSFESAKDAVNLGAFAYVEKLGHPEELVRQVHRAAQAWMAETLHRSEAQYRQLVDSVHAVVWRRDPATGRFRFVSHEAEMMLGYSVQQWLSEPTFWQDHIHPEDRDGVFERCAQATADRQSQQLEYRMIAANGRLVWLRDFVNIIVEAGQPSELVGVMIDITEQKRTAEALRRSEDSLKEAQRIAHLGNWELDLVDGTLAWSDEMFRIHGLDPVAFDGDVQAFVSTAVHPDDQEDVQAFLQQARRECGSFMRDYHILQPDGAERLVSAQGQVFCEDGKPVRMVGVVQDITEREKAARALAESEKRYRILTEHAAEAIVVLDVEDGSFVDSNSNAEALYGLPREALHQTSPAAMSPKRQPDGRLSAEVARAEIMKAVEGEVRVFEWMHRNAQGHEIPCEVRLVRMPSVTGRVLVRGSVTDITDRKRAEEALRKSEQSFRLMFANNPLPMWVYDRQTHAFLDVNDAALAHYGYDRAAFLAMKIEDIRPAEDIPRFRDYIAAVSETVQKVTHWRHQKKDGTLLDVEITAHDFPYSERPARLVLANDITERKRLEKEILEISNREQRRIGQDLHDGLGQLLTGIGFRIAELEGDLQTAALPEAADAAELGQMVERAIAQTRALAHGLDPVNVEQQGLPVALRELTQSIESIYGVACLFVCPEPVEVHDPEVAIHIYRIAQESINNALKHAHAARIEVTLHVYDGLVGLTVSDDGVGLPTMNPHREGMGLRIMDYRARMIGGTFEVDAGPAGGTVVACRFPQAVVQQPAQ